MYYIVTNRYRQIILYYILTLFNFGFNFYLSYWIDSIAMVTIIVGSPFQCNYGSAPVPQRPAGELLSLYCRLPRSLI